LASTRTRVTLGELGFACAAAAVVLAAADHASPVYADRAPVVRRLIHGSWRDSILTRAPWAAWSADVAMRTPQFEADRRAFLADLVRTGRIEPERADSLATFAVREAYRRRVPPALVFGVMLAENEDFRSSARSTVGAVGLMQIAPRVWLRSLGPHFGTDLSDDETNLRYGVFILSHFLYAADDTLGADSSVRQGLLRYNGCVRGANTPGCHGYPDVVRRRIEQLAHAQCGAHGYEGCVARPLRLALTDEAATW
jgi:hypothetical protein